MAWVKLDDQARQHRKLLAAGPVGAWLWTCGLMYCNSQKAKDGFIPEAAVPVLYPIPGWKREAARLVSVGLWERVDEGYKVHDYHEYQPSSDAAEAISQQKAAAGRAGGVRSGAIRRSKAEAGTKHSVEAAAKQPASLLPKPVPSRPDPDPIRSVPPDPPGMGSFREPDEPEESGVPASEWAMHDRLFIAAYERAAQAALGNPMWTMRRTVDLQKVLAACCRGPARADVEGWIGAKVHDLVAFIATVPDADRRFWPEPDAGAMLRWFNRKAPRSDTTAAAPKRQPEAPYHREYVDPYEDTPPRAARAGGGAR